jgi:multiple antibiotic resistance protein
VNTKLIEPLQFAFVCFTAVLAVVDPIAVVPLFLTITSGDPPPKRRQIAKRAAVAMGVTLSLFAAVGGTLFQLMGISIGAFRMAGGLMVLLVAIDMLRAQPSKTRSTREEEQESVAKEDVAIVPLAVPMLAGPGAMATVMVFMGRADWRPLQTMSVFGAIAASSFATWLLLRWAITAERFIRKTTLRVIDRIMGLLLAAIGIEFVVGGLRELLPSLR